MLKRVALLAGLTLLLGVAVVPSAHARPPFSLSIHIGPSGPVGPYDRASRAPAGYIWQPGYYMRTPYGDRWVPGTWVPDPYFRRGARGNRDDQRWERERRNDDRDRNWRPYREDSGDWDLDRRDDRRDDRDDDRQYWPR